MEKYTRYIRKTSVSLPIALLEKIRIYNDLNANRPINISAVCRIALEKELEEAVAQSVERIKKE